MPRRTLHTLLAREIWIKEGNFNFELHVGGTTFDIFELLFDKNDFERAVEALPSNLPENVRNRLVTKARNLRKAAVSVNLQRDSREELSIENIQNVHRQVVRDLSIYQVI
jgi:hypothetical protein